MRKRKFVQMGRRGLLAALFSVAILCTNETIFAESQLNFSKAEQGGDEDGSISAVVEEDGSRLQMEYQYKEDGYHTATVFFENRVRKIAEGSSLIFEIKNESDVPVRMNIEIIDKQGEMYTVSDDYYVLLKDGEVSTTVTEQGCFSVPADFAGVLEVPLALLSEEKIEEIMGYGLVCVAEDRNAYHMVYENPRIEEEGTDPKETAGLLLIGSDEIRKAKVGESETYYEAEQYNLYGEKTKTPVTFSIRGETENIEITDEGWLIVKAGAEAEKITLAARTKDGMTAEKQIVLQSSWTESIHTDNGYDASIASPTEIAAIDGELAFLVTPEALWIVRAVCLLVTGIVIIYYILIRRKAGRKE